MFVNVTHRRGKNLRNLEKYVRKLHKYINSKRFKPGRRFDSTVSSSFNISSLPLRFITPLAEYQCTKSRVGETLPYRARYLPRFRPSGPSQGGTKKAFLPKTERSEGRGEERGKERKKGEKRKRKKGKKKKRREKKAPVERNLVSRRSGGRDGGDGRRSGGEQQRGEESAYRGRGSRRIN